jgi:plastocyanin
MRHMRNALATVSISVIAVAVTAPAAMAAHNQDDITSFGYTVSPTTIKPGDAVDLTVTDCSETAFAESGIFDRTGLGMGTPQSARVNVDTTAKPGAQYEVTFTCGNETGHANLTIASNPADNPGTSNSTNPGTSNPGATEPMTPGTNPGPAKAGSGGSQGRDTTNLALGAGLVAASAAGAAYMLRRRTSAERS